MDAKTKDKIWAHIAEIKTAMMVMNTGHGMKACPMQIVQDSFDEKIWFFTHYDSEKSKIISQSHEVCLTFEKNSGFYISLSGQARVIQDKALIQELWSPTVETWFPKGQSSNDVALIEIDKISGEYWDAEINTLEYLFEITKAHFTQQKPEITETKDFA